MRVADHHHHFKYCVINQADHLVWERKWYPPEKEEEERKLGQDPDMRSE